MMQWLIDHIQVVLTILLLISESASAFCQLVWPDNKGIAGIIASIIKLLQVLGAKK